jgi:hypothetical protein
MTKETPQPVPWKQAILTPSVSRIDKQREPTLATPNKTQVVETSDDEYHSADETPRKIRQHHDVTGTRKGAHED